jgi:hypothetical protein
MKLTQTECELLKAVKYLMANRDQTKDSLSHFAINNILKKYQDRKAF